MSKYAIIQLAGKQFKVSEGDSLVVDRLDEAEGSDLTITDVLMVGDDEKGDSHQVGAPVLDKATVTLKVVEHAKGDKIKVLKYKSKSRYRKTYGHRQHQTKLDVIKISA